MRLAIAKRRSVERAAWLEKCSYSIRLSFLQNFTQQIEQIAKCFYGESGGRVVF